MILVRLFRKVVKDSAWYSIGIAVKIWKMLCEDTSYSFRKRTENCFSCYIEKMDNYQGTSGTSSITVNITENGIDKLSSNAGQSCLCVSLHKCSFAKLLGNSRAKWVLWPRLSKQYSKRKTSELKPALLKLGIILCHILQVEEGLGGYVKIGIQCEFRPQKIIHFQNGLRSFFNLWQEAFLSWFLK